MLTGLCRSRFHHQGKGENLLNLEPMRLIGLRFREAPWCGCRQMARYVSPASGYQCVHLHAFETGGQSGKGIGTWIAYHNQRQPHFSLD